MYKGPGQAALDTGAGKETGEPEGNRSLKQFATERSAKDILCKADCRYRIPTASQKKALLIGFAICGKALAGSAYDAVRLEHEIDLDDPEAIARDNAGIVLIEIKSTSQEAIGQDLKGYFFNITSAELLVAQSMKDQYRFLFLNLARGDWQELSINEVLSRSKGMYPAYHIRL